MKSSVCIEMIFTEVPFLERFKKSAEAGFDAIEFWNWDNKDLPAIKAAVEQHGLGIEAGTKPRERRPTVAESIGHQPSE